MFLANPRVRQAGGAIVAAALLIYGLVMVFGSESTVFDRFLGVFIALCGAVAAVAGVLASRETAKESERRA